MFSNSHSQKAQCISKWNNWINKSFFYFYECSMTTVFPGWVETTGKTSCGRYMNHNLSEWKARRWFVELNRIHIRLNWLWKLLLNKNDIFMNEDDSNRPLVTSSKAPHNQVAVRALILPSTPETLPTLIRLMAHAKNVLVGTEEMEKKPLISLRMRPNTGEPSHTSSKTSLNTTRWSLLGQLRADSFCLLRRITRTHTHTHMLVQTQ